MEKYKFGIIAEKVSAQTATDFEVTDVNPYSSAYCYEFCGEAGL